MTIDVVLNQSQSRYEARIGSRVAGFAQFQDRMGVRVFHAAAMTTEFEGHGLGSTMLRVVLDMERAAGRRILARAPLLIRFIERNPEYRDLLAPRGALKRSTPAAASPATGSATAPRPVAAGGR